MTTLTQWHSGLEKQTETAVLRQTDLQEPLLTAVGQLPPPRKQVAVPPLRFILPANTVGMAGKVRPSPGSAAAAPSSYVLVMPKQQLVSLSYFVKNVTNICNLRRKCARLTTVQLSIFRFSCVVLPLQELLCDSSCLLPLRERYRFQFRWCRHRPRATESSRSKKQPRGFLASDIDPERSP